MSISSFFKKLLVIGAIVSAIVSAIVTYYYLPQAFSIFDISITMNRNQAIEESHKVIASKKLLTEGYEHAGYFSSDNMLQYYVELVAGGKETFKKLIAEHVIEPYTWVVRWYKEGETQEATIEFTASGVPYSFSKKVPELEEGPILSEAQARKLAEREATKHWNIDFSVYKPFEYSKKEQPSKRVDHTFVYQRDDRSLGEEGKYRVKIIVSGDNVTTVSPFVFIPESFMRRYEEMRAENNTITIVALSFYRLLYLFGGIVLLGAFLLYRRRLHYFYALIVATVLSIAVLGTLLSQWPFLFIDYNTALSKNSVWLMYCLEFGKKMVVTLGTTFLFTTVICAIDKWVFPKHESIWNFFTLERAARRKMLWYVLGGYLGVCMKLAATIGIYLFLTGSWMRWWSPASRLVNPNVLALGIPWLEPIVDSFSAGFTEELLFRAIPLSVAMLLGRFFRREKLCIVVGLFIQALIFTALHANYSTYPAYFRIVEMFPSALAYGVLYLRYGLIPGIIMHWIFDLFLMSLPIMVSTASGMFFQKIMIVVLGFFPLGYVLYARYKIGYQIDEIGADQLDLQHENVRNDDQKKLNNKVCLLALLNINYNSGTSFLDKLSSPLKLVMIVMMGMLIGRLGYKKYQSSSDYSRIAIVSKDVVCNDSYERMMKLNPNFLQSSKQLYCLESHASTFRPRSSFAWRTMSHEQYFSLADNYIYPIGWNVRYVHCNGTQVERSEGYCFVYSSRGKLLCYIHTLSDQIPGVQLHESQARKQAFEKIQEMYDCNINTLKEINCESIQKPLRLDWKFTFEDTSIELDQGKACIEVLICGDEICCVDKFIFVPEAWMRAFDQENVYIEMISFVVRMFFYLIVLLGAAYLKRSSIAIFDMKKFFTMIFVLISALFTLIYFRFSMITYTFQTSIAWINQIVSYLAPTVVLYIIISFLLAIALLCYRYSARGTRLKFLDICFYALFFALIGYCMEMVLPRYYPGLGDPTVLNNAHPTAWFILQLGIHIIQAITLIYVSTMTLTRITQWGTRYKVIVPCSIFFIMTYALGFSLFSVYYLIPLMIALLIVTIVSTILYYGAIRYDFFTFIQGYVLFAICSEVLKTPEIGSNVIMLVILLIGYCGYIHWYNRSVSC